jgi:hypothetical protein
MPTKSDPSKAILASVLLVTATLTVVLPVLGTSTTDEDGDGVGGTIEVRVCGSSFTRDTIDALEGAGACETTTDYAPDSSVGLLIPNETTTGRDADGDGFPESVTVDFDRVRIDRTHNTSHLEDGPVRTLTVDDAPYGDDGDPGRPGVISVCRRLQVVTGISSPVDEDGDGFPSYAELSRGEACVDHEGEETLNPTFRVLRRDVDPDDGNASTPSGDTVKVPPVHAGVEVGPDADGDTVVSTVETRLANLTYDRRNPADPAVDGSWRVQEMDPDDGDAATPRRLPSLEEDGDDDHVLDGVEYHLCRMEDGNRPEDGSCEPSSTRRGPTTTYKPTPLYQLVTAPAFES